MKKIIICFLFVPFLFSCLSLQRNKNDDFDNINNKIQHGKIENKISLNTEDESKWTSYYMFPINNQNEFILLEDGKVKFFYELQHANSIELKSHNIRAMIIFERWLKSNNIYNKKIIYSYDTLNFLTIKLDKY